ncbi:MAG: hypothetical protein MK165_01570 [Pirellulaceae bacterium]|nr:hypothetical protein [Pirellulaceae bacterium]
MSVGPMGMGSGVGGLPLPQGTGSGPDREKIETAARTGKLELEPKSMGAQTVGQPERDEAAPDRDPDGRLLWVPEEATDNEVVQEEGTADAFPGPSRQLGANLDLLG